MTHELNDDQVEAMAYAALRLGSKLLPATDEELAAAEREAGSLLPLPSALQDPMTVLTHTSRPLERRSPAPAPRPSRPGAILEGLARAAREGGVIPTDVEEEMRRQRQGLEAAPEEDVGEDPADS